MTAAQLTPQAALDWLASLSVDLRAAAVLDGAGGLLAGDPTLARRAAVALAAAPGAAEPGAAALGDGELVAVRSENHAVVAAMGPLALRRLALADLHAALGALEGR